MDALTTYHAATNDGVAITLVDGELQVEAKKSKAHWLAKLKPHKAAIIAHLTATCPESTKPPQNPRNTRFHRFVDDVTADNTRAWQPFPLDALPITLRAFAREWAASIPCDPAAIVLPMLAVVASAIGMSRRLAITSTWFEPCFVWSALVADSGSMKSAIMGASVGHLDKRERQFATQYKEAMKEYERRKADYERDAAAHRRGKLTTPPDKPEEPARLHARLDDVTLESLAQVFTDNPRGTFVARDELAALFGSFDKYNKGGGDAAAWLSLFGGRAFSVRRKTGNQAIYIPAAGLSLTGTIQPERMKAMATAEHRSSGMIARFLLAMPPRKPKLLLPSSLRDETRDAFDHVLDRLFSLRMANAAEVSNSFAGDFDQFNHAGEAGNAIVEHPAMESQPEPVNIELEPEAFARLSQFVEQHDVHTRGESGDLQASYAKLEGYVPRLALLFHLASWAESELADDLAPVPLTAIEQAIVVVEWFRHEQERVYQLLGFTGIGPSDGKLIELMRKHDGQLSPNELRQRSARYKDDPEGAELALQALVDKGQAQWETIAPHQRGGRPTRVCRLT